MPMKGEAYAELSDLYAVFERSNVFIRKPNELT